LQPQKEFLMSERSNRIVRNAIFAGRLTITAGALLAVAFPFNAATAQAVAPAQIANSTLLTLPDAPDSAVAGVSSSVDAANHSITASAGSGSIAVGAVESMPEASPTQKFIRPGQIAPDLTGSDKVLLGLKNAFMPFEASGWFASAGYSQIMNSSPNYGTDRGAFGQRLGAAAVRDSSESIFSDSVMANFFHEDPRYYQMGPAHNFFVRLVYSGTRPIFTRMDSGHTSLNFALLSGTMGGAALTNLYYPPVNRGTTQTMETFGGSLGGAALSDVVSEFYDSFKHMFHSGQK
jgi:hypothetical protein